MSKLIAIDAGHGISPKGNGYKETPYIDGIGYIKEYTFNKAVAKFLDEALKRCGFKTIRTSQTDDDISLPKRCNIANNANADIFISCHYNHSGQKHPNSPGASGVETYYLIGLPSYGDTARLAKTVHKHLLHSNLIKQKDRGVKTANFQVLRDTKMPAILIEYGFMDDEYQNYLEAKAMIDPNWQKERAEQTAKGVCEYFGVKYVSPSGSKEDDKKTPSNSIYRVTVDGVHVGSFAVEENILNIVKDKYKNSGKIVIEKV